MTSANQVPAGFKPFELNDGFNRVLQPLYLKYDDAGLIFGMQIEKQHLNFLGICHGGVYMTFMDFALSGAVNFSLGKFVGTPTVNLSLDFMAPAKMGDFIWADVETLKTTRTLGFSQGLVRSGEAVLARANACFKLPKNIDQAEGISVEEYKQRFSK